MKNYTEEEIIRIILKELDYRKKWCENNKYPWAESKQWTDGDFKKAFNKFKKEKLT